MDPKLLSLLRRDLLQSGYSEEKLASWFPSDVQAAINRGVTAPASALLSPSHERQNDEQGAVTLARLFHLGEAVSRQDINAALPALGSTGSVSLGLIKEAHTPDRFRASLSLTPYGALWILSDLDDHLRRTPAATDHVMGVGGATRSLSDAVPHTRVGRALEIGTGCGVVALQLAAISPWVIATDVAERALVFARANAILNDISNVEFRLGDMWAPVQGETFDLIVSNPPFVISPVTEGEHYAYRTSGEPGDGLLRRMLRDAPQHLAEHGSLICLANWEYQWSGGDGDVALRSLVPAAGISCSAWLIERGRQTPLEYASLWLRDGGLLESDTDYTRELMTWISDLTDRRVSRVCFGYLSIRKTPEIAITRSEKVAGSLGQVQRFGDAWKVAFDHLLHTALLDPRELLEQRFVLASDVEEVRTMIPGTDDITSVSYITRTGIERFESIDTFSAAFLGACDGELTVGEIASALAELLDVDSSVADDQARTIVREFTAQGYLLPFTVE